MAPSQAVRLLMQPSRGVIFDQFVQASRSRARFARLNPPFPSSSSSVCFRCSVRASFRLYSTDPKTPGGGKNETASISSSSSTPQPTSAPESTNSHPDDAAPASAPSPELPSISEAKRSAASAGFSTVMDNMQSRVLVFSQKLNDLTGYSAIETIKAQNEALENDLAAAQTRLRTARQTYKTLTSTRASTQREVTTLLARKDTWSPSDLERFTTLYRSDHELEAQVAAASAELTEAEALEGKLSAALNMGILRRYHEEQIWSDRIRRQSTWGTWGLMGINVLLFLTLQFVAEPWKRARLVRSVAEGEKTHWEEVRRELGEMKAALEGQVSGAKDLQPPQAGEEALVSEFAAEAKIAGVQAAPPLRTSKSWSEVLSDPQSWREGVSDLYSERRIDLRMRDASLIALEAAVTGAAVAAGVAFMLLRKA